MREYNPQNMQVRDTRTVQAQQVQRGGGGGSVTNQFGDADWAINLFGRVAQSGANTANKLHEIELAEKYLEGQVAAEAGKAESELQTDPITRDWSIAGHRDVTGRMALAEAEAKFISELPTLRTKPSEEVQAYLGKRREALQKTLSGMSRSARSSAVGQVAMMDKSAFSQWQAEHQKWITETEIDSVMRAADPFLSGLRTLQAQAAVGDTTQESLQSTIESFGANVFANIWANPRLSDKVRSTLTKQLLSAALAQDSVGVYEMLAETELPDGQGKSSVLARLDPEDRAALGTQYREAYDRSGRLRDLSRQAEFAQVEQAVEVGEYPGTYESLADYTARLVVNRAMSEDRRTSVLQKFLAAKHKKEKAGLGGNGVAAFLAGDVDAMQRAGISDKDAIENIHASMNAANASPAQRISMFLTAGRNGQDAGFKEAGKTLAVTFSQLAQSAGEMLPQHRELFNTVHSGIKGLDENAYTVTRIKLLSGLPEESRVFAEEIFARVDSGESFDTAVQGARANMVAASKMTPAARAAMAATNAKERAAQVNDMEVRGIFESGWLMFKGLLSEDARNELKATPFSGLTKADGIFGDTAGIQQQEAQFKQEFALEQEAVAQRQPFASASSIKSAALAGLAARTVSTKHGPMYFPKNSNPAKMFGVSEALVSEIGPAISEMLPEVKDSTYVFQVQQGRVLYSKVGRDGTPEIGNAQFLEGDAIRAKIAERVRKGQAAADVAFGQGKSVTRNGITVKYNGINNAGAPAEWMVGFRDNLIQSEGVVSKPGPDGKGVAVGVGVNSVNPNFPRLNADGTVSSEAATAAFLGASEDAARNGMSLARRMQLETPVAFKLLAEMSYQGGTGFQAHRNKTLRAQYQSFLGALRDGDAKAVDLFKDTEVYRASGESRRQHYLQMVNQILSERK